ncbi:hypothetical protein V3C99_014351 [Haemonchus contortus]
MITARSALLLFMVAVIHLALVSQVNSEDQSSSTSSTVKSSSTSTTMRSSTSSTSSTSMKSTAESSSTASSSSMSTTASTMSTTAAAGAPGNKICPKNTNMNDKIRLFAREAHNYRRSHLAQGLVKNKAGKNLPKASDMTEMRYNCDLEESADAFAKQCTRGSDPKLPSGEQQNHFYFMKNRKFKNGTTVPVTTRVEAMRTAIKHWWKQVYVDGGIGKDVTFTSYNEGKPIQMFTRMAWANSDMMGCGVASCGDYWSVVCHYKPGGNVLNEHLYMKGAPCSACPGDMFCTTSMLCAPISTVT